MPPQSSIGIADEHLALADTARRWAETHADATVRRASLDAVEETLPKFWEDLAGLGWLGLAVDADHGGQGHGLLELAIVLEELGRVGAPGPFLPTVSASAVLTRFGTGEQRERWLPGLCDGSTVGAVALGDRAAPVLGGGLADLFVVPDPDSSERWFVLERDQVDVEPLPSLDATRRVARVGVDPSGVPGDRVMTVGGSLGVTALVGVLAAAEAVGGTAWCVDTAAAYARDRRQFGRPIGQFQAVKHRCADMAVRLEQARGAAWDAVRGGETDEEALAADVAGALVPDAFYETSKDCIQVLGGIGFTWEHDAHLYFKRATSMRLLLSGAAAARTSIVERARAGVRRTLAVDLPPEADAIRADVRHFVAEMKAEASSDWNRRIAEAGYLVPNWPEPWGRGAGAVEQLVIDEVFAEARVRRPHLAVGAWALPTIIGHGTSEQQERWIPPTLSGEVTWCQMFSEPGAGSDLAGLSTRAERVGGGWSLTGQKVWTTLAHQADWGICLARTDPDAPKHLGITCFIVDMSSDGLDVRPLRELTGQEMFNEVFLDAVFVPDDAVIGEVDAGWEAARTTLANERVSMGSGSSMGPGVEALLDLAVRSGAVDDPLSRDELGSVLADAQSLAVMGLRMTLRALQGAEHGPEASVRKLLGVLHDQRVQEVGLGLLGPAGVVSRDEAELWIGGFLGNRSLSIAGGTSEIQRNVIAERLLGLPKDP